MSAQARRFRGSGDLARLAADTVAAARRGTTPVLFGEYFSPFLGFQRRRRHRAPPEARASARTAAVRLLLPSPPLPLHLLSLEFTCAAGVLRGRGTPSLVGAPPPCHSRGRSHPALELPGCRPSTQRRRPAWTSPAPGPGGSGGGAGPDSHLHAPRCRRSGRGPAAAGDACAPPRRSWRLNPLS